MPISPSMSNRIDKVLRDITVKRGFAYPSNVTIKRIPSASGLISTLASLRAVSLILFFIALVLIVVVFGLYLYTSDKQKNSFERTEEIEDYVRFHVAQELARQGKEGPMEIVYCCDGQNEQHMIVFPENHLQITGEVPVVKERPKYPISRRSQKVGSSPLSTMDTLRSTSRIRRYEEHEERELLNVGKIDLALKLASRIKVT